MALKQIDQIFAVALFIRSKAQVSRHILVHAAFLATVAMTADVIWPL